MTVSYTHLDVYKRQVLGVVDFMYCVSVRYYLSSCVVLTRASSG